MYLWTVNHGGVAQYTHLCLGTILVAQLDRVVDDLREMRMTGRLTITGKREYVGQLFCCRHLLQFLFQSLGHFLPGRQRQGRAVVFVEAALTVDTVERTHLTVGRQEVDAQRDTQSAAMHWTEDG